MSYIIGICDKWGYNIAIYDKLCDEYKIKEIRFAESSFEKIILNLKNEFKKTKIYVVKKDPVLNITNDDSLVQFLSIENMEFTTYFSVKLSPNTKIMKIDFTNSTDFRENPAVKCVLYEFVGFSNSISEYKPIKCFETRTDVEDIYGLLKQIFNCNLREIHAIYDDLNGFSLAKFEAESEHFCSFTKSRSAPIIPNGRKVVIYGRFLLNDENVQSLVKLRQCSFVSDVRVLKNFDFKAKEHISSYGPVSSYKSQTKLMGIDLGASRIVVCISRNNSAQLFQIDKEYSMPSVISFTEEEPNIGSVAMRHLGTKPKSVIYDLKHMRDTKRNLHYGSRSFGLLTTTKKTSFVVKSQNKIKQYSTIDIYQILFKKLKTAASVYQSGFNEEEESMNQMVITVPNFENKMMLADICEAAKKVGINIIDIITETQADLLYFLTNDEKKYLTPNESIVVIDIGGGTGFIQKFSFDQGFGKKHDLSFLCGKNINEYLKVEIYIFLDGKVKREFLNDKYFGLAEIEKIKEALSFEETVFLDLPITILEEENPPQLTRTWFEQEVIERLFTGKTNGLVHNYPSSEYDLRNAIQDVNYLCKPSKVFLVGGSCRIPYIQNYFKSIFGEDKVFVPNNLQDITATGALIHGLQILNPENDSLLETKTNAMVLSNKSDQSSSKSTNEDCVCKTSFIENSQIVNLNICQKKTDGSEKLLLPPE